MAKKIFYVDTKVDVGFQSEGLSQRVSFLRLMFVSIENLKCCISSFESEF